MIKETVTQYMYYTGEFGGIWKISNGIILMLHTQKYVA